MTKPVLASRRFGIAEQRAFAAMSGDYNPMHLDAAAARRTQAGDVVVHGVHALLWALEVLAAGELAARPIASLRAQFHKFIYLDRPVDLRIVERAPALVTAELVVEGLAVATLTVAMGPAEPPAPLLGLERADTILGTTPLEPAIEAMNGAAGWLTPPNGADAATSLFPTLCTLLDDRRVIALAQTSTLVGMACPGLHSIFSSLNVIVTQTTAARRGLGWSARLPDPRYKRVELTAAGAGLRADIRALVRPPPVDTPSVAALASQVQLGEFTGRRALVIGGSRGLGAASAKLLAAGGARVVLTYASAEAEAEAVVADIRAVRGAESATKLRCDVSEPFDAAVCGHLAWATHVYYFATPRITRQSAGVFNPEIFADFTKTFVERFNALCVLAADIAGDRNLNILVPSSEAITARPKGMTEYAMSKAAAELLCADLRRAYPRMAISTPRLPRVLTDQTAVAIPVRALDAAAAMLPLLRDERPA